MSYTKGTCKSHILFLTRISKNLPTRTKRNRETLTMSQKSNIIAGLNKSDKTVLSPFGHSTQIYSSSPIIVSHSMIHMIWCQIQGGQGMPRWHILQDSCMLFHKNTIHLFIFSFIYLVIFVFLFLCYIFDWIIWHLQACLTKTFQMHCTENQNQKIRVKCLQYTDCFHTEQNSQRWFSSLNQKCYI